MKTDEWGATFTISNTGIYDGAEVAQLYAAMPDGKVFRSSKELKGFPKIFLKAGESRTVSIPFDDKTFRRIAKMTGGAVSMEMVSGMVQVVNGHFFKGMKKIIGGFFANDYDAAYQIPVWIHFAGKYSIPGASCRT